MKFLVNALTLLTAITIVNGMALKGRGSQIVDKIKRSLLWDYQNDKIRGVNLGGWFVLEPYITPSLFEVFDANNIPVDEYHYCQQLGKQVAQDRLETHWQTWYSEDDFEAISGFGLNLVRIPIGYWAFQLLDNDPYVQGQTKYLDQALEWARTYNLKVWIDLHGAPGSQNGFDNSGLRDTYEWQSGNNVQITLDVLLNITEKYGGSNYQDVVIGIELVNEPLGPVYNMDGIVQFCEQGYSNVRATSIQPVIVHDAFQAPGYWDQYFSVNDGYWDVVIDHHHYQVFSQQELQLSIDEHIEVACQWGTDSNNENHWNLCGEWSAALTDCALWLNGVGRGARYSGDYDNSAYIGSCSPYLDVSTWSSEYRTNVRKYIEAQLDAFELRSGWIFWNWKCEDAIDWDFKRLNAAGIFPNPLTAREYPNQCNF